MSSNSSSSSSQTIRVPVCKTIPWKHSGERCIATGLAKAYYAIFVQEIQVILYKPLTAHDPDGLVRIEIQALGEWDLGKAAESLFCVVDPDDASASWNVLAQAARKGGGHHSRFLGGRWVPDDKFVSATGFYKGHLEVPLRDVFSHGGLRYGRIVRRQLLVSFHSLEPWRNAYPITSLLEWELDSNTGRPTGEFTVPHTSAPVSPEDPWSKVFPPEVLARFLERFQEK